MNEKSEEIGELVKALVEAQKEIHHAKKDSENPHFRSGYASLASVIDAVRAGLSKHNLTIIQKTGFNGDRFVLETVLAHISGQSISGQYLLAPDKATPQGYGSALSYARRYSLLAILNIASEDDDGHEASQPARTRDNAVPTEKKAALVASSGHISQDQVKRLWAIARSANWAKEDVAKNLKEIGLDSTADLNHTQYKHLIDLMTKYPKSKEDYSEDFDKYLEKTSHNPVSGGAE